MANPLKTVAIKSFLKAKTHPDLANLYSEDMEVQVIVGQDGGTRVSGEYEGKRWLAWSDGIQTWKPIRVPRNANTEPVYTDSPMNYNLDEHAEGIGMTGWDWKNRLSRWVAYDFDAITGHSDKHQKKLTSDELNEIKLAIESIPWTTLRLSTSGKGLHLYVFLEPVTTANHTEHAALARSILHLLSGITGCDFNSKVDVCGGNMWVWHRKMVGTPGLTRTKHGIRLNDIPPNWRDHTKVTSGKTKRNLPAFVENLDVPDADRMFEELTGQRNKVKIDQTHKELFAFLTDSKALWWWDADHHMLVTHTIHLKDAHGHFGYKGIFETVACGSERGNDHNCFAFPLGHGAWAVRRYSLGTQESSTWDQDGKGWTRCYLNREIDLATASRTTGGNEHPSGGWFFETAEKARSALRKLGAEVELPEWILTHAAKIKAHPKEDGKVTFEIPERKEDYLEKVVNHKVQRTLRTDGLDGWVNDKKSWKKVFMINVARVTESTNFDCDSVVRHLVNMDSVDHGWVLKVGDGWNSESLVHVQSVMFSLGLNPKEVKEFTGSQVSQPWKLVNIPFSPEYPGDRQWNIHGAQLRYTPNSDQDNLSCPTWNKILNHIGKELDDAVKENEWCSANGIVKGSEYLKCWVVSMFKEPLEPLPYLFLWGDQNSGKSIFHEALSLLLTRGFMRVDHALANPSGFNGEMENAVLCVIEEMDLKRNLIAYNRIKDWVTSKTISIHKKGKTPYLTRNCTHFVQCANQPAACPIFPGDTRITMVEVKPLESTELIPKKQMLILLEKEASDFIADLMKLELPISNDRLNIPVLTTADKTRAEEANETELEIFLKEHCHYVPGAVISVTEMWDKFKEWLDPNSVHMWTKIKMGKMMPNKFPKGRLMSNPSIHYGNISFRSDVASGTLLKSDNNVLRNAG